jgi:hypothetical protein
LPGRGKGVDFELTRVEQESHDDLLIRLIEMGVEPREKRPGTSYPILEKAVLRVSAAALKAGDPANHRRGRDLQAAWRDFHDPTVNEENKLSLILFPHLHVPGHGLPHDDSAVSSWRATLWDPLTSGAPKSSFQFWSSVETIRSHVWNTLYNPIFVNLEGVVFIFDHDMDGAYLIFGHGVKVIDTAYSDWAKSRKGHIG